jgi:multidrug resistance protein, MATE family
MSQSTFNEKLATFDEQRSIEDQLQDEALMPRFFKLSAASVLSNLMVPLATMFSTAFLGHLTELHHLAGVALAGNLLSFVFLLLVSLRMSTTGLTAQAMGENDRETMILVGIRNGAIALVLGLGLMVLQYPVQCLGLAWVDAGPEVIAAAIAYFKAYMWSAPAILVNYVLLGWLIGREQNRAILLLSLIGTVTNIAFDYLLVVHWHFASLGAGLAVSISQYLVLAIGLGLVFREVSWQEIRGLSGQIWQPAALKEIFGLNSDFVINNLFFTLALVIFNYEGIRLGMTTYSENALLIELVYLNAFLSEGIGFGVETLSGHCQGQGDRMRPLLGMAIGTSLVLGLGLASMSVLFPQQVFGLLSDHLEVLGQMNQDVLWLLPVLGLTAIAFVLESYFLGLTKGAIVRNISVVSFLVGFLPASIGAWMSGSNSMLWLSYCLFLLVRIVGFGLVLPRTLDAEDGLNAFANLN